MAAPYMGGFRIVRAEWTGSRSITVRLRSTYGAIYHYQLYAGRTLIGVTEDTAQRVLAGTLQPSLYPQHLTVLAVSPANRLTDYGDFLPLRPYNRIRITFTTADWTDAAFIDVTAGTAAGEAVDDANRLLRVPFDTNRQYQLLTPPMPGSGTWQLEVTGVDDTAGDGNAGTPLAASQAVLAHPPDIGFRSDGSRLGVSIAGGTATITFGAA